MSIWSDTECDSLTSRNQSAGAVEYTDCISTEGVRAPSNEYPVYNNKQYDGEAPVILELLGMRSTSSLPFLPCPLWPGVVAPEKVWHLNWVQATDLR